MTRSRILILLAFAAVYLIWGSTYLAIRYAIETLPPFLMAASRFLTAGLILFVWALAQGESIRASLSQWPRAFIIGALLLLCGNGGVTWAEKYIASGLAALLIATEPLLVVMLNWAITRHRPNTKVLFGVFIGFAGVALLIGDGLRQGELSSMSLIGAGVVVLASVAWAGGSVYVNRRPIQASTSMASGMQMIAGGSLLFLLALTAGDFQRLNLASASWRSVASVVYLTLFGSLVAFTAYSWLLRNVTPARAATYAYVNPVVAVLLGWLFASEPITSRMLIAAAIIVGSVALITTYGTEQAKVHLAPPIHDSDCPTHPCA